MTELKQNGFVCEYEMGVFMRMYFMRDEEAKVFTDFSKRDGKAFCECRIDFKGMVYKGTAEISDIYGDYLSEKVCRNTVIMSFCNAAENIRRVPRPWGVMSGIRPTKNIRTLTERGYSEEEIYSVLENVYGVSPEKCSLAFETYKNEREILKRHDKKSVGIYIGIPFCPTRCSYCSFISAPMRVSKRYIPDYIRLLCKEIEKTGGIMKRLGVYPESIYIGGGTPTSLSANELEEIFDALEKCFDMSRRAEYTLEAGRPDTITMDKLECAKRYKIDRISINPQTMHGETLERIGRKHKPEEIGESFEMARAAGFKIINMDLIAGLPGESFDMFRESLDRVCGFGSENITVHTMYIKRASEMAKKDNDLINAGHINRMLVYTQERMKELGYAPYYMYRQKNTAGNLENVGYAKKGTESVYNIKIMEEVQSIIALGGGGSSKLICGDRLERVFNFKDASEYIRRFDEIIERKEKSYNILKEFFKEGAAL